MFRLSSIAMSLALAVSAPSTARPAYAVSNQAKEVKLVDVGHGITLRRMVWRNPDPQGYVLLLHGFPETVKRGSSTSMNFMTISRTGRPAAATAPSSLLHFVSDMSALLKRSRARQLSLEGSCTVMVEPTSHHA
jgi:hypothetical protein